MIARQSDTFRALLRVASEPVHGDLPDAELLRRFAAGEGESRYSVMKVWKAPLSISLGGTP